MNSLISLENVKATILFNFEGGMQMEISFLLAGKPFKVGFKLSKAWKMHRTGILKLWTCCASGNVLKNTLLEKMRLEKHFRKILVQKIHIQKIRFGKILFSLPLPN